MSIPTKGIFHHVSPIVHNATLKAGETCINICNEWSHLLLNNSGHSKTDNFMIISMIQELLQYAKLQFLKTDYGGRDNEGVLICDTFQSHTELLQSLLIAKALPSNFTFADFKIPQKTRYQLDSLYIFKIFLKAIARFTNKS
jgi:hypothetical protein